MADLPKVPRPEDPDFPVGIAEIAERLGVARDTVDMWRLRGREDAARPTAEREPMPDPDYIVGRSPAWRWREIEQWAARTGRAPAKPDARGEIHLGRLSVVPGQRVGMPDGYYICVNESREVSKRYATRVGALRVARRQMAQPPDGGA